MLENVCQRIGSLNLPEASLHVYKMLFPEPDESSPHPHTLRDVHILHYAVLCYLRLGFPRCSLQVFRLNFLCIFHLQWMLCVLFHLVLNIFITVIKFWWIIQVSYYCFWILISFNIEVHGIVNERCSLNWTIFFVQIKWATRQAAGFTLRWCSFVGEQLYCSCF
jgi:hypothetical protein